MTRKAHYARERLWTMVKAMCGEVVIPMYASGSWVIVTCKDCLKYKDKEVRV